VPQQCADGAAPNMPAHILTGTAQAEGRGLQRVERGWGGGFGGWWRLGLGRRGQPGWQLVLVGLALAAGCIAYARWHAGGFKWQLFRESVAGLDWRWLGLGACLALLTYLIRALRWGAMMRGVKDRPGLWNLVAATAVGFAAVVLLGRAGEIVRPYLIAVRERVPLSSQLGVWTLERLYDLIAVLFMVGLAVERVGSEGYALGVSTGWVIGRMGLVLAVVAGCCVGVMVLAAWFPEAVQRRLLGSLGILPTKQYPKVEKVVAQFLEGFGCLRGVGAQVLIAGLTGVEWLLIGAAYWCLFRASAWTASLGAGDLVTFMGLASLGSIIQLPALGGGVQVATAVVLREVFGAPLEVAAGLAVVYWATTFVVIVPVGLAVALALGINCLKANRLEIEVVS